MPLSKVPCEYILHLQEKFEDFVFDRRLHDGCILVSKGPFAWVAYFRRNYEIVDSIENDVLDEYFSGISNSSLFLTSTKNFEDVHLIEGSLANECSSEGLSSIMWLISKE